MRNQNIVCIFAHPDDEAFGPSGIIAKWSKNNKVYIICITDGSHPNSGVKNLKNIRSAELKKSASILGVKKVFFLNYCDGELRNNIYHDVASKIQKKLDQIKPTALLTFEMHGVSGHIDHIFVSMVSTYLFSKLKYIKKIYYFCENKFVSNMMKNYFIYFPNGYEKQEVDNVEDVSGVLSLKIKAAKAHISQKEDMALILKKFKYLPAEEYYLTKNKSLKSKIFEAKINTKSISQALLQRLKKGRMI